MNKATIIEDAITYIEELQKNVMVLQEQLCELEASSEVGANPAIKVEVEAAEEMKQSGIQVCQFVDMFMHLSLTQNLSISIVTFFFLFIGRG